MDVNQFEAVVKQVRETYNTSDTPELSDFLTENAGNYATEWVTELLDAVCYESVLVAEEKEATTITVLEVLERVYILSRIAGGTLNDAALNFSMNHKGYLFWMHRLTLEMLTICYPVAVELTPKS